MGLEESAHTKIYYFIDGKLLKMLFTFVYLLNAYDLKIYTPASFEDAALFQLDPVTRMVSLTQQLDRENIDQHRFRVIATNRVTGPQGAVADSSYLVIEVNVS